MIETYKINLLCAINCNLLLTIIMIPSKKFCPLRLIQIFWCFNTTFSNISAISCDQFQRWRKTESPERTTDRGQVTGILYHLRLRVECTLFCNLQSWAQTHAVLVIGLYELLDPPTQLIEPPGPLVQYEIKKVLI